MSPTPAMVFDVVGFLEQLRARGCALGEPLHYHELTASTNDDAKRAAKAGALAGTTFVADAQRAGRGRLGRRWFAAPGESLLFSTLLYPRLDPERLSCLTLAVGLGVRRALAHHTAVALGIKWPNDVYADGKKLAGVLVEADTQRQPSAVVVGVGINVATREFPAEIAPLATSMSQLGAEVPRETLLVDVLAAIDQSVSALEQGSPRELARELARHDILKGRRLRIDGVAGVARGIDERGRLLLQVANELRAVGAGTVEIQ